MEKNEFLRYTGACFKRQGFEKIGSRYYFNLPEKNLLCEIQLQKSFGAERFYVNFKFFIGIFQKPYDSINRESGKTYTPCVGSRFYFTENDFYSCQYPDYDKEKLELCLDYNMEKNILPVFEIGKKYLLDNYNDLYTSPCVPEDRIIKILSE